MSTGGGDRPCPQRRRHDAEIDLSMIAVNQRLRRFIEEHRAAQARGERGPFTQSNALLCGMAEQALEAQARAALERAELERRMLAMRGGRLQ